MVAEEVDLSDAEDTLLSLDHHATERQSFEDLAEMIRMFCSGAAAHKDVIQVDEDARDTSEYGIHESLKCLSSILESKRHAKKFPKAKGCDDGCFADVLFCHWNLVVSSGQVNFGENSFVLQISIEIANVRDGIAVVYGGHIEVPEITTWSPATAMGVICKDNDHGEIDLRITRPW